MQFIRDVATDDRLTASTKQIKSLTIILRDEFGVQFRFYEATTGAPLNVGNGDEACSLAPAPALEGPMAVRLVADGGGTRVQLLAGVRYQLVLPFPDLDRPTMIAVGVLAGLARSPAECLQEQSRLGKWLRSVHDRLCAASQSAIRSRQRTGSDPEAASFVGLEALMGLERLLRNQRIDRDRRQNLRGVLQTAAEVLKARTVVYLSPDADEIMIEGEPLLSPWDCDVFTRFLVQDPAGAKTGYLINNRVQANSWGARFPQVVNLLAVPIPVKKTTNWIIVLNKKGGAEPSSDQYTGPRDRAGPSGSSVDSPEPVATGTIAFRRTDAALLLPMAALLGVHLRASRRHRRFKGLLVQLTRALATAIDARDSVVAGHSERVARIAVELGRELGLQEEELSDLYLAGLLHDIGTLGLPESILCKRGPLSPEERERVRQHATIGHNLLAEFRPIAHILPAVLHHRERHDGSGSPDGLKGDTIPFLARILAVADCYESLLSLHPDHPEPSVEHVEEILCQGADIRWDARVVAALSRCGDRIQAVRHRGSAEPRFDVLDSSLHHDDSRGE
jgi:HD-GYP domain-containing protein (c-di-GMP phosphodiesterase class II)